jgi:RHS repeat-associated protein
MMKQNMTYRSGDYSQKEYPPDIDKYIADYDAAGRLPGFANFNGTQTTYGYDNANRLTAINNLKADSTIISNYTFTLDGNGNRTNIDQTEPYAPAIGEGATIDYTYNTQKNRLTAVAGAPYTYDNEGQLLTSNGGVNSYTFDYEHRLKTIAGGSTATFYYDGGGNRLKAVRSSTETRYIYDAAGKLLAEADSNNNITKYYIYGNGLLAMVTPANDVYCYHYNGVGSTIALTDNTQAVVNQYSYDAFGNIADQQEAVSQPFKYVGQAGVMTEPNGFYYMKARYYDPTVGRFISEDPIGFEGGDVNLMAYVGNNPVTGIDPSGLWDVETHGVYAGLDSGWTSPLNPFSTHLHFTDIKDVNGPLAEAISAGNSADFNKYMHMGQDSFDPAHKSVLKHIGLSIANLFGGPNPDRPETYPAEADAMRVWTKTNEAAWDRARTMESELIARAMDTSRLSLGK